MSKELDDCPCSGKNIRNLAAPWILLTLRTHEGIHGYELSKIIGRQLEELGISLNMTGLYRHLNTLEKRGMLASEWDTAAQGPARRIYYLTETGQECLLRWIRTLTTQMCLIDAFFEQVRTELPDQLLQGQLLPRLLLPKAPGELRMSGGCACSTETSGSEAQEKEA